MNQVEMQEKIEGLLKDEEFCKKFFALKTAEEMSDELAKHDIDATPEDLRRVKALLKKKADGELSDAELEGVAGGFVMCLFYAVMGMVVVGTAAAATVGAGSVGYLVTEVVKRTAC